MRLPQVRCSCSEIIVKSTGDTSKIRSKILIVRGEKVFSICKGCNSEVEVPLEVSKDALCPPLFIKNYQE